MDKSMSAFVWAVVVPIFFLLIAGFIAFLVRPP